MTLLSNIAVNSLAGNWGTAQFPCLSTELALGLEPRTARLQVGCATSCAMPAGTIIITGTSMSSEPALAWKKPVELGEK